MGATGWARGYLAGAYTLGLLMVKWYLPGPTSAVPS